MPPSGGRFGRADRLRKSAEFRRVTSAGSRRAGRHVILLQLPRVDASDGPARLGVTVSRKVGGAVERNRVKRRLRAWFRTHRADFAAGTDFVVIARTGSSDIPYTTIGAEVSQLAVGGTPRAR